MTSVDHDIQGLLVLPRLRIQNANAISSPLTHGFPSMTAFLGLMWALDRKLAAAGIPLVPVKVGVVCHGYEEQVQHGYVDTFHLTRNPVDKNGDTAAIVEEGRIHLDITLVLQVDGGDPADPANILLHGDDAQRRQLAGSVHELVSSMRVAGGSVLPTQPAPGKLLAPQLLLWPEEPEERVRAFRRLRRQLLPGFTLVSREDLLRERIELQREQGGEISRLSAWLDLSRFNYRSETDEHKQVTWQHDRPPGAGWLVPIPVGYGALSPLHEGGQVLNARDNKTPFRFVESLYSLGQWISPHRLHMPGDLLWYAESSPDRGSYRCCNDYIAPPSEEYIEPMSVEPSV